MMFLRRLLSLPLELIKSPSNFISGIWQDGGRGQFLVLGMPAVIFMLLAVTALGLAFSNDSRLKYEGLATSARDKAQLLRVDLQQEPVGVANSSTGAEQKSELGGEQKLERTLQEQLEDEQKKERIFLEKLVSLEPNNPEHKFKLALLELQQGNAERCESLMQVIAPFDKAGYTKAHLYLAEIYLRRKHKTEAEKALDLDRAEKQVDQALIAEQSNVNAKVIKAYILNQKRQYLQAYAIFEELFDKDPIYYQDMLKLAGVLKKTDELPNILDRASYQFRQKINSGIENVKEWVDVWSHYVFCLKLKRDYATAENALRSEIEQSRDEVGKEVFLKQQLSRVYSERAISMGRDASLELKKQQLSDLHKSFESDPKNEFALEWLTILGSSPEIGDDVRKIYDPQFDPNPNWRVLFELGNQALGKDDFESSITYFERARKQNPREPRILNNLAFSYLEAENRNPEQALLLVDQAITVLNTINPGPRREEIASSFYDTRGVALMQLDRMEDAAAALEVAFRGRPDNLKIIERLIECYEATGNERQAESYRRRAEALKKDQKVGSAN